jgi:hypothetical protein
MLDRTHRPDDQRRARRARYMRAYRQREAAGRACVLVEIGADEIEFLVHARWLAEPDAMDKAAIGAAITAMLKDASRR